MSPVPIQENESRLTEELGVEFVCSVTQALFLNRQSLRESTYDDSLRSGKIWLKRTLESATVRQAIAARREQWFDIGQVLCLAIPSLEDQSIPSQHNVFTGATTSSALMLMYYDQLMTDLERLNDILLIARNCLATTQQAQNYAGDNALDYQVLSLIELCVKVTARGYDGETPSRAEQPWANVIGAYKKLLITSLQFLHNLIMKNETRKLALFTQLFPYTTAGPATTTTESRQETQSTYALEGNRDSVKSKTTDPLDGGDTTDEIKILKERSKKDRHQADQDRSLERSMSQTCTMEDLERAAGLRDKLSAHSIRDDVAGQGPESKAKDGKPLELHSSRSQTTESGSDAMLDLESSEPVSEYSVPRTPQSAAMTLQVAKDQLMARLADQPIDSQDLSSSEQSPGAINGESPQQEEQQSDEEDGFQEDKPDEPDNHGLLTDVPLVLGPHEIEALPMIVQIGICPGLGAISYGRDMQAMRCNLLLASGPGRNLLRELLIFIAAWDLQEGEVYFKLMMQIMEAVLENNLMPYAYQKFAEVKDIVSPAQSMVIKLLTQIFRGKQDHIIDKGKVLHGKGKDRKDQDVANPHANASRRVNVSIVRYIFTMFRSSIIPETCALIYLQGQIKAGAALPEDFPLNLWDMERVYEGVYQFLEFFAVLTESEEWKELLVNWEITSELITLLRELEASIPKPPITVNSIPQTLAEAQLLALQAEAQRMSDEHKKPSSPSPAPVSVERPFDLSPSEAPTSLVANANYPTLPPAADVSEQESVESADPSEFEWRNLKKLVILVLSSLVWKSPTVQGQVRQYGGVEMVLACCSYDGNNPYIREHAIMCLRFVLEGSPQNQEIAAKLQRVGKVPVAELMQEAMAGAHATRRNGQGGVGGSKDGRK